MELSCLINILLGRFIIKKLIFCCILLVFLSLIFTCRDFEPVENTDEITYTDVEYSEDGSTVTIYLDGPAPVPASRALSKSLAILGHDFFEVTFMYHTTGSNYIIARGTWELGESAGVSGVQRRNLANTADAVYDAPIGSSITADDKGTAVIFAGKKTDKTLLAVGELCAVDGNTASRTITSETKSVSFELNALKAGSSTFFVTSGSPGSGSASGEVLVGTKKFPVFPVNDGLSAISARYEIQTHSTTTHSFSYYRNGIILAPDPPGAFLRVENIKPHYTYPDDDPAIETNWQTANVEADGKYEWSQNTTVALDNNTAASGSFVNPITFTLNTTHASVEDGQILSVTFQIPVQALSADESPVTWFIRPGYDSYRFELDNGQFGNGGAVLVSIGIIADNPLYSFRTTVQPPKKFYNGTEGYTLDLTGSQFQFILSTGNTVLDSFVNGNTTPNPGNNGGNVQYYIDWNNNFETTGRLDSNIYFSPNTSPPYYWTDGDELISGNPVSYNFQPMNRYLTIIVQYSDPVPMDGVTQYYYTSFKIFISTLNVVGDIPINRRFVIGTGNDVNLSIGAQVNNNDGLFLFVFTQSMDINDVNLNPSGDVTIIITTVFPDLTLGRGPIAGGGNFNFTGTGHNVTIFFGKWPFNEPTIVAGLVLDDQPFRINTIGSYTTYGAAGANYNTAMIQQGVSTSLTVIKSDEIPQWGNHLDQ